MRSRHSLVANAQSSVLVACKYLLRSLRNYGFSGMENTFPVALCRFYTLIRKTKTSWSFFHFPSSNIAKPLLALKEAGAGLCFTLGNVGDIIW